MRKILVQKKLFIIFTLIISINCQATGWSINLGVNNPINTGYGLNFMHLWTNVAVELGLGSIQSTSTNSGTSYSILGDVNLKYLFGSRVFRPYLQAGINLNGGAGQGASVSTGSSFIGAGFFAIGNPIYIYISYSTDQISNVLQYGFGYSF